MTIYKGITMITSSLKMISLISIAFLPMILVESSFSVDQSENRNDSKLTLLQELDDVIKTEESLGKDQKKIQELKNAREQYLETLKNIELMRNKIALLKEKIKVQNNQQNSVSVNNKQRDSQLIYTIQIGSFVNVEEAQVQFDLLLQILKGKAFSFLRIEKIGKYYSVRLGKFTNSNAAKQFIITAKPDLANADILKAYIKEERIIRFNTGSIYVLSDTLLNTTDKSNHNLKGDLYLRQILVDTRSKAENIIDRIAKGELFEEVALKRSKESNAYAGGYMGRVDPSNLHPAIADALLNNDESKGPAIVETERGFHIVQRVSLSDLKDSNKLLATDEKIAADRVAIKNQSNIESFKALIKTNPQFSEAYYNLGVAYSKSGEYKKAVDTYKEAIARNPNYFNAYVNLGVAYSRLDMYGNAITAYQHAININPDDANVHLNLGVTFGQSGMYGKAVTALKRATELDTHNAVAHYNLGFAYLISNDKNSAINEYEILKNIDTELANELFREIHE